MANVKITELTADTNPASTDVLPIVDISADETKKVTIADLLENAGDGSAGAAAFGFDADPDTGMYRTGTDALALTTGGTGRLFINSGGNVGIGVTPTTTLHVKANQPRILIDTANSSGINGLIFGDNGTTVGAVLYNNANDSLQFRTNGANERLRITSTGNVGIGTSSPADSLHISSSGLNPRLKVQSTGSSSYPGVRFTNPAKTYDLQIDGADNGLRIYDSTASAERMRIDSTGNARFTQSIRSTASNGSTIIGEFARSSLIVSGGSQDDLGIKATGNMRFAAGGNTERMRITSGGNVGIGTSSPGSQLEVAATAGAGDPRIKMGSLTDAHPFVELNRWTGNGTSYYGVRARSVLGDFTIETGGTANLGAHSYTERFRVKSGGRVGIGTSDPDELLHVTGAASELKYTNTTSIDGTATTEQIFKLDTEGQKNNVYGPTGSIILRQDGNPFSSVEANYKPTRWEFCTQDSSSTDQSEVARLTIDSNGSLSIFNGTAPTTSATNGVKLYAEDVSSSSELKVRDEAGNVTTLSPHNFDLIPEGPSEDMAWSYYSERDGKRINVDMLKAVRLLEQLSGEQLVFTS